MDADLYVKTVKGICIANRLDCMNDDGFCPLYDQKNNECLAAAYHDKTPVPIVEQWLADHPEPKPLPKLPEKLPIEGKDMWTYDKNDILTGLMISQNAIIDYLAEREEKNEPKK